MIGLTNHAIERYRDRICPALCLTEAQERLTTALRSAQRLSGRTKYGSLRYALPFAPCTALRWWSLDVMWSRL